MQCMSHFKSPITNQKKAIFVPSSNYLKHMKNFDPYNLIRFRLEDD